MNLLPFEDPDYGRYENYFLFNFSLLPVREQLDLFYVRDFSPVTEGARRAGLSMDSDYNQDVVNPVYQLFVSGFWYASGFLDLIGELFDDAAFWRLEGVMREAFSEDFRQAFFENVPFNTSVDGFWHGAYWAELRQRAGYFLGECGLVDDISFGAPMKFRGFLYPDDFNEYRRIPYWSPHGQVVSLEEWNRLRQAVLKNYEKSVLKCPELMAACR